MHSAIAPEHEWTWPVSYPFSDQSKATGAAARRVLSRWDSRVFLAAVWIVISALPASAGVVFTSFGSSGQGGIVNGQSLRFGTEDEVYELDGFLNIAGSDLNGGTLGTSAQLSRDVLPPGLTLSFTPTLSADRSDLTLEYRFRNGSGVAFGDVQFFVFLDAQIDTRVNTYFNEAGQVIGTRGGGASDPDPDSFEIDEPGYVFGDVFQNLLLGSLDNLNALPSTTPDDVSLALGFRLGTLLPGQGTTVRVLLSDDGDRIGSFGLRHFDTDPSTLDTLTLSGQVTGADATAVPEPSTFFLLGIAVASLTLCRLRPRPRRQRS